MVELQSKIIGAIHGIFGLMYIPFLALSWFYGPTTAEETLRGNYYASKFFIGFLWLNVIIGLLIMYSLGTLRNWGRYLAITYDGLLMSYFMIALLVALIDEPHALITSRILFLLIPVGVLGYIVVFLLHPKVRDLMRIKNI